MFSFIVYLQYEINKFYFLGHIDQEKRENVNNSKYRREHARMLDEDLTHFINNSKYTDQDYI